MAMTTINFRSKFIRGGEAMWFLRLVAADLAGPFGRRQRYGCPSRSSPSQGSGRNEWRGRSSDPLVSSIS
jgi:hypothetical protein